MIDKIPQRILNISEKFIDAGFEIYLVGGCVRDLLHERNVTDWDLTTNATPNQMLELFPDSVYENDFGTVGLKNLDLEESEHTGLVEVTTFRTEKGHTDRRHPDKVEWGKTIEEDLGRRDFTINAIALKISNFKFPISNQIIDPFSGQDDLKSKLIRAVGDPKKRFKEDALRLMRAIRFASQLGFSIEEKTLHEIKSDAELLSEISKERIRDELIKILASSYPYEGMLLLKNTGLLRFIIPELLEGIGVSQVRPGRHHTEDVFTHNLLSLKYTPASDPVVRLAALIHDIGKPRVRSEDEEGLVIFYNHEIAGARLAREIASRLRFSKKEIEKIQTLVRWHMFTVDEKITDAAVRRFIRRIGVENVSDMMDLRVGDRLGGGTQTAESWRLKLFKKRLDEQMAPEPFSIKDLVINGKDVMNELKIKPSRRVGEILQKVFEEVDENLEKNNRDFLLKRIKEL